MKPRSWIGLFVVVFFINAIVFLLTGCNGVPRNETSIIDVKTYYVPVGRVLEITIDDHDYLIYYATGGGGNMIHKVGCRCGNKSPEC